MSHHLIVFRKLLRLAEAGYKYNEARSYGGIGTVVCSLGNYEKSEENLKKSIEIFHVIGTERRGIFLRKPGCYLSLPRTFGEIC